MEQLLRAQFRHLEEMQQQQQQAFKEMREEHRNELKRLEERLEAQVGCWGRPAELQLTLRVA